jgi:hypothetical protein
MNDVTQLEPPRPIESTTEYGPVAAYVPTGRGRARGRSERYSGADARGDDAEDTPAPLRVRAPKALRRVSTPEPASRLMPPSSGNPAPKQKPRRHNPVSGAAGLFSEPMRESLPRAGARGEPAAMALRMWDALRNAMSDEELRDEGLLPEAQQNVLRTAVLLRTVGEIEDDLKVAQRDWEAKKTADEAQMKAENAADEEKMKSTVAAATCGHEVGAELARRWT